MGESTIADVARDEEREALVHLSLVPGIGPALGQLLIRQFGSARAVLEAAPGELRSLPGVGEQLCQRLVSARQHIDVRGELEHCRRQQVEVLTEQDEDYPRLLREIHDPPAVLYVRGQLRPQDALAVAIVGTRHASPYGLRMAGRLATSLAAAGLTVVSGLARGIDAAAHRAALEIGGRTVAVLAGGLAEIYPPEHADLAAQIARQGAQVSEAPLTSKPRRGAFPRRNRLISGMTLGVIVVEAGSRSGALSTARHALEQGREVFAVPGPADSRTAHGCHQLIRDGARLVETAADVLEELGPLVEAVPAVDGHSVHHPAELQLNDQERQVLQAIERQPTSIDQIARSSGLPVQRVLATLSVLEMRHLVDRFRGNRVRRK